MAKLLDRAIAAIGAACGLVAAVGIIAIAVIVIVSIVSRLLGIYVAGLTNYAGYGLAISGAFGMAYTFIEHGHIRVDVFIYRLRGRPRFWTEVFLLGLSTSIAAYLAFYLVRMTFVSIDFQDRSDGSDQILIWIPQAPFAAGYVFFALVLSLAFLRALIRRDLEGPDAKHDSETWG